MHNKTVTVTETYIFRKQW